ncbi:RNA polymerase [Streptomyces sp. NPDC000594]|uniref:RNA polymerase n=1 Tax=Streptomyces sp. NPDC000594 TaxID=3154261 RepID=UPI00331DF1BF
MRPLRAREFEDFVTGAAGRLLHVATLLTAESATANPRARRLLVRALAGTYARWHRLRGEDPYSVTREDLITRFARGHGRWSPQRWTTRGRRPDHGVLRTLTARERLVVVLRLYELVGDEQTAALVGLPVERMREICRGAVARICAAEESRPGESLPTEPAVGTRPGEAASAGRPAGKPVP